MGPIVRLCGMKYILVVTDYVSKLVEVVVIPNNKGRSITTFWKINIFSHFRTPIVIIRDGRSHFCNYLLKGLLENMV